MSRIRLSKNGPEIAREGFDVETAEPKDMFFMPMGVAARIKETGIATPVSISNSTRTCRVNFAEPFSHPPMMFFAGLRADGGADVTPNMMVTIGSSFMWRQMHYYAQIDTTGFDLFLTQGVGAALGGPIYPEVAPNWRWWALENTMQD